MKPKKTKIKAVIFDLDGTLSETNSIYLEAYQTVFTEIGLNITDSEIYHYYGISAIDILKQVVNKYHKNTNEDTPNIDEMNRKLIQKFNNLIITKDTISKNNIYLVKWLREQGLKTSIGTGTPTITAENILKQNKILFDYIITPEYVTYGKPEPDIFLLCAEKMGFTPKECLVIGDTQNDIIAGIKAGMLTIGILSGIDDKSTLMHYGAYTVINNLNEVKDIIISLLDI
ncbi:MAG: HAD family phosphatase [DPANN group archaeon]|nr:HAD family phosphatase [DPANN group archaeon]